MAKLVTDIICPFCGTLCDDIEVEVSDDGRKILKVLNACRALNPCGSPPR